MDIRMEESKIENSSDHQVSPSLDPSTNETSTGIPAKQDEISRDGSNSNTINPNEPVANINSEPPLGEIPKINSNFGNYDLHIYFIFAGKSRKIYHFREWIKKYHYILTLMLYVLSLGLIYIPIGIFIRQFFFKTIIESSTTTNILWYHMGHNVFGLIGYGIFSSLYMKVSIQI